MKVGIAGGTGLIGRNLAKRLLELGHSVRIFSRSSNIPSNLRGQKNLEVVGGSFPKAKDLEGLDGLVNLAGSPIAGVRWTDKVKEELRSSRVDYTENLVSSFLKIVGTPPKVFIQGSAVGYYGSYEKNTEEFSEDSPLGTDFLAGLCSDWEHGIEPILKRPVRLIRVRTGIVLSKDGGALKSMLPPFRLGLGGPIGSGNQIFSWIHIDDAVNALVFALENSNVSGALNLTAPNPVDNGSFTKTLGRVLRRPAFFRVPATALKILFDDGAEVLLKGQRVLPKKLMDTGYSFQYPNLEEALRSLLRS
ncbi:TIGR01777 family oxidoreductase [Leptospira barantonii]|uniref:TIGR01777 family protein n=1 Tax=Leptospira barantonii TaxID=2023184 RepID=A0ABX4NRJ5_9LEPT|nr:TIGR01777 family oxidoreductase [Leptospira barantonii]PJZ59340.1 TIGR01777 family protein [Leptospira barantonii]